MGKSSLVQKALTNAREGQCVVIDVDFQAFDEQYFERLDILLRYLADTIHGRLQLASYASRD